METKDIISITLASTALFISLLTFILNYRHTCRNAVLGRKPVLVFLYDGNRGWMLRNIGNGPALNIIVAQKHIGGNWFNPVRIPSLPKDGEFIPIWLGHVNTTGLGATYTDFENKPYTSTCGNDLSQVFVGKLFGPWTETEIGRHWNQPLYYE
jgi:hypothetical protein